MRPDIQINGVIVSPYQICVLAGLAAAGFFVCAMSKKRGIKFEDALIFLFIVAVGAYLGGAALYGLTNYRYWHYIAEAGTFAGALREINRLFFSGSVFYGGLFGGTAFGLLYLRLTKRNIGDYADLITPAAALFHVFGRIGCFLSGCCYGVEFAQGVVFRNARIAEANNIPRFPVQLAEAGFELVLFAVTLTLFGKERFKGKLFRFYLGIYAVGRFFLEFLRGDGYRGIWFGLSTSQWISAGIIAALAVSAIAGKNKRVEN